MMQNSITIFPNYATKWENNQYWFELSHPLLIDPIIQEVGTVNLAASLQACDLGQLYSPLNNKKARVISLGRVKSGQSKIVKGINYLKLVPRISRAILQSNFCYIFTPGHVGLLATILCWCMKKPYGLYLRGEWRDATPRWFHCFSRRVLVNARFVLCTGETLATQVKKINARCEAVVPMSPVLFCPKPVGHYRVAEGIVTILFVGSMIRAKGIFDLLDALQILHEKHCINAQLIMVGDGLQRASLEKTADAKGLRSYVHCIGPIYDPLRLANIYIQSDIFCLPTLSEGFPRVIYEAMRFSLPIVTTNVGQIGTVIENGRNGLIHPPNNSVALVECMLRLILDPALRTTLGAAGRETLEPLLKVWQSQTHGDQVMRWLRGTSPAQIAAQP